MSVEFNHTDFQTGKNILAFPDHYVCKAHTFLQNDEAATTVDGKKIIKAGTIYPSNDADAIGVVWADYDVTKGDVTGAIIIHGFVKKSALPAAPADTVNLPMIAFLGE